MVGGEARREGEAEQAALPGRHDAGDDADVGLRAAPGGGPDDPAGVARADEQVPAGQDGQAPGGVETVGDGGAHVDPRGGGGRTGSRAGGLT